MFDEARYHDLRTSRRVGAAVVYRDHTASTMDDARAGAIEGAPCGTAYVAGEQTAGRGRHNRRWVSADGAGLYVTYHLCQQDPETAALVPAAAALAVGDSIAQCCDVATSLKWPNDVLHDGRKLAGILAEALHRNRIDVFVGVGINVRAQKQIPPDIAPTATSIEAIGARVPSLAELLAGLSDQLERWTDRLETEPADVVHQWRGRLTTIGSRVRFESAARTIEGNAIDVSARGELLVRDDAGMTHSLAAGDVRTLSADSGETRLTQSEESP